MGKLRQRRGARRACASVLALAVIATLAGCGSKSNAKGSPESKTIATSRTTQAPPAIFPLTGLPVDRPDAGRPSLAIKIDNLDEARPQSGLNFADIVYDTLVEGGQTRLFAVFQSHDADVVGPIRSARPVDADLLRALNGGLFAYSGAAPGEIAPSIDHSTATLLSNDDGVTAFYRAKGHRAPHNVYASTAKLYAAGAEAGNQSPAPPALFHFGAAAPGGQPTASANVPMGNNATAAWAWNPQLGQYERTQDGTDDTLEDGTRVTADNVLVMSVGVTGTGVFDVNGVEDPLPVVIGSGPCWLLRDGQLVQGTWSRDSVTAATVFHDAAGHDLVFHTGRTWVELQQNSLQPTFG
ncbi:MAG TPA: DUF3048 domain-containing protein [Acidimicrobiales bacterium]|nr:DUF3048 domain-containing protein [Acidimicrobiales bacterium]